MLGLFHPKEIVNLLWIEIMHRLHYSLGLDKYIIRKIIFSEDPIASSDTVKSTPTEIPEVEESVPVCLCQNCPDLEKEQFSRCCHSNVKAKGICTKLAIQCICLSPKLEKFFDKVRYELHLIQQLNYYSGCPGASTLLLL